MRRAFLKLLAVAAFSTALLSAPPAACGEEWQSLFNGKDLSGWHANAYPGSWRVEDGAIRAQATRESSHLFFVGQEPDGKFVRFRNFVLELSARSEKNANSGIYFHTDFETRNRKKHLWNGYEVQLNASPVEKRRTGSLYGVVDIDSTPVDERQWFRIRITVRDRKISVQLNDQTVVDYSEPQTPRRAASLAGRRLKPDGGAVALQAHDPRSVFYFKDIRIKRLP